MMFSEGAIYRSCAYIMSWPISHLRVCFLSFFNSKRKNEKRLLNKRTKLGLFLILTTTKNDLFFKKGFYFIFLALLFSNKGALVFQRFFCFCHCSALQSQYIFFLSILVCVDLKKTEIHICFLLYSNQQLEEKFKPENNFFPHFYC